MSVFHSCVCQRSLSSMSPSNDLTPSAIERIHQGHTNFFPTVQVSRDPLCYIPPTLMHESLYLIVFLREHGVSTYMKFTHPQ